MLKNCENNGTEEIVLVTPTPWGGWGELVGGGGVGWGVVVVVVGYPI